VKLCRLDVDRRHLAREQRIDAGVVGRILYLPRPMNSERTFCVSIVSMLKTVVRLVNVGTPIVRM
jgi:hypothetical protein